MTKLSRNGDRSFLHSGNAGSLRYHREHGFFIIIRHLKLPCSFLHPTRIGVRSNAVPYPTFFFSSDVVPSSYHSCFQPLRILPFLVEVAFHSETNGFS